VGTQIEPMATRGVAGYQAVVDHLRREFTLGRIRPGERLPAERQLAERLGVARETLRQAYRVLEGAGQLEIRRGSHGGAVVLETLGDKTLLLSEMRAHARDIAELIEFRTVVEAAAAELAALRRTPAQLDELDAASRELDASELLTDFRHADTRFHLAVAAAAGNTQLEIAIEDARVAMFQPVDVLDFDLVKEASIDGHAAVLDAIRAGDPARAATARAMRDHIGMTREHLDELMTGWGLPRLADTRPTP
jgi:DNA-binding FadR family transcriptional regulator